MRKYLAALCLSAVGLLMAAVAPLRTAAQEPDTIEWYTWEEAIAASEAEPRKIIVDVYTSWCGWCKQMDKTTFKDEAIVRYINENYYAVKFDAEQKESIQYRDTELKFLPNAGRRGTHELAYSLLDGRLGYPSIVYLDEEQKRITISPGYKSANKLMLELRYVQQEIYKTAVSLAQFAADQQKKE